MSNTNTCTATRHGYACVHPAGHSGRHLNHRGPWRDPERFSCGTCGLTFPDSFGADQCCSVDPAHCEVCAGIEAATKPRERWHFAGRGKATTGGEDFYVWQLRNPNGSVNSSWLHPVSALLGGKL